MTIQNKLFTAITSTFTTNSEIKALKAHLNTLFDRFAGNKLNDSKLDKCFSDFIGAKNTNTFAAILEENNVSLEKAKLLLKDNARVIFDDIGKNFESYDNTLFVFDVPLIKFQSKCIDTGLERSFEAVMQVRATNNENSIYFDNTLYLFDLDDEDYVEIPDNWDLEQDDLTNIWEEYLEFGKVNSKIVSKEIINLMGFTPTKVFKDYQFIVDASTAIATHISYLLKHLTDHQPTMLYNTMNHNDDSGTYHEYELKY